MADNAHFAAQLPEGPLAAAVSGGVDSLCALLLCLETGRPVLALHARLFAPADEKAEAEARQTEQRLRKLCEKLGCSFHVMDLEERFKQDVVLPFTAAYANGLTPNPCSLCNRRIKFGAFWDYAQSLGAKAIVTGHYASLCHDHPYKGGAPLLCAARDKSKDQSYFISLVPRSTFAHAAFPLANLEKTRVREIVASHGLQVPAPKESQEICFVPQTKTLDYRSFLEESWRKEGKEIPGAGDIIEVDSGKVLGRHQGLWQYTEGQRQGLRISWHAPLYVIGKRLADNALLVGTREHAVRSSAALINPNFMVEPDELPQTVLVRLRYRQKPVQAKVCLEGGELRIQCLEPVFLSAPGQTGVVLDDELRILAAGEIAAKNA